MNNSIPQIIDTHCHLDSKDFAKDLPLVLKNAREHGIQAVVNIGVGVETNITSYQLAQTNPGFIYNTVGAHPADADDISDEDLRTIAQQAEQYSPVAIGEIGLDYHYSSNRKRQREIISFMFALAKQHNKPVVIHNRDADDDMLAVLTEYAADGHKIVLHSYLSGPDYVARFVELGCYFGIGGPLTFKSGGMHREAVKLVPLDRMLLETDAPWLTPHPYRGKRNEPAHVSIIAKAIAEQTQTDLDVLCEQTSRNAKSFFALD